jgi:hypothetical protein
MDPDGPATIGPASPPIWRWVLSFLAVGACWGFTTPFMRRAAVIRDQQPKHQRPYLTSDAPWVKRKIWGILYAVMDLLRNPAYAVPLLLNVTGSVRPLPILALPLCNEPILTFTKVWFFLLIGQAGMISSKTSSVCSYEKLTLSNRIVTHRPYHEFARIPVHRARRMVGRRQSHITR